MLPRTTGARVVNDFQPSVTLLYKTQAYMILGRSSPCLEAAPPEEQHGFPSHRRIEENLITPNMVVDKLFGCKDVRPRFLASAVASLAEIQCLRTFVLAITVRVP